jgi:hypothetical protein
MSKWVSRRPLIWSKYEYKWVELVSKLNTKIVLESILDLLLGLPCYPHTKPNKPRQEMNWKIIFVAQMNLPKLKTWWKKESQHVKNNIIDSHAHYDPMSLVHLFINYKYGIVSNIKVSMPKYKHNLQGTYYSYDWGIL